MISRRCQKIDDGRESRYRAVHGKAAEGRMWLAARIAETVTPKFSQKTNHWKKKDARGRKDRSETLTDRHLLIRQPTN